MSRAAQKNKASSISSLVIVTLVIIIIVAHVIAPRIIIGNVTHLLLDKQSQKLVNKLLAMKKI